MTPSPGAGGCRGSRLRRALAATLTLVAGLPPPVTAQGAASDSLPAYTLLSESRLEVRTGTSGLLGGLADAHTVRATSFSGTVRFAPGRIRDASVTVSVPVRELEVRTPVNEEDRRSIRETMRTKVLAADEHPTISFTSTEVTPAEGDSVRVTGELTLAGRTRSVSATLALASAASRLWAWGSFTIRQTDFGIEPYSLAFGTVSVSDRVTFYLDVVAEQEGSAAGPGDDGLDAAGGELHLVPVQER